MSSTIKISAIIITKNESANIRRCLNSLDWADEIIVVDNFSTDNTREYASEFSNVKIFTAEWHGFSGNKRIAVSHASNEWIFWIDADEEVSKELKEELINIKVFPNIHAYDLPRKTFFLGDWVKHCGWYPGRVIRFFNKNYCDFNNNILHEGIVIHNSGVAGQLKSDLLHYSYISLYQYFDKMNYYGKSGAEELKRKGKKFRMYQLIFNPISTFVKFYFLKKGFLDGKKGFIISVGSSFSNFIKYTNFYYLEKKSSHE